MPYIDRIIVNNSSYDIADTELRRGFIPVQKATEDADGNVITTTYATKTESGHSIVLSLDPSTYKLAITLKNVAGDNISTDFVDLPEEDSITGLTYNFDGTNPVVNAVYRDGTVKPLQLTDIQRRITSSNLLGSDLVTDSYQEHKFVSNEEKNAWNRKVDSVTNATAGNLASLTAQGKLADSGFSPANFATAAQGELANTAVQTIKRNGVVLDKSADGTVNMPVPTELSELWGDSTHRTVTDAQIAQWNEAEKNVQANWAETNTSADSYIQNKPEHLVQDANYVHTDENFTSAFKTKLEGIEAGAEVNVQASWTQTNNAADDYIINKPTKTSDFINDGNGSSPFLMVSQVVDNLTSNVSNVPLSANQGRLLSNAKVNRPGTAVEGNLPKFDSNKDIIDSGLALSVQDIILNI